MTEIIEYFYSRLVSDNSLLSPQAAYVPVGSAECGLKPLSQAQADGDQIYAVIRGSSVNQDGQTNGISVPKGLAQEAAIREVCMQASIWPEQIQYIEAHGTGTPVGDPIEANALGNAGKIDPLETTALSVP